MELKDILKQLDFTTKDIKTLEEDDATPENFSDLFKDKFIARQMAHKDEDIQKEILGKRMTDIEKQAKKTFGLTNEDVDGKFIEDVLKLAGENHEKTLKEKTDKITELEDTAPQDEKLSKLQGQYDSVTETKVKLETDLQTSNKKIEDMETDHKKELNKIETQTLFNNIKSEIKFADSVSSLEKSGFFSMINDKFDFKLDEGKLMPVDKKGEQIPNENNTSFLNTQEILMKEAGENKLLKVNAVDEPKKVDVPNAPESKEKIRTLHPNSQNHAQDIKNTENIMGK